MLCGLARILAVRSLKSAGFSSTISVPGVDSESGEAVGVRSEELAVEEISAFCVEAKYTELETARSCKMSDKFG